MVDAVVSSVIVWRVSAWLVACVVCGVVAYVLGDCVRAWAGGLCGCVSRSARWGG